MWSKGRSNEIWCFDHSSLSSSMKRVMAYFEAEKEGRNSKVSLSKGDHHKWF